MRIFPFGAPPLERVGDHAGIFGQGERRWLEGVIDSFERHFPQIHWRLATVKLNDPGQLGLFGFWLLNVSPTPADERDGERAWTVLLLIEAEGGVAMVPGYAVEPWLSPDAWETLLGDFSIELRHSRTAAIEGFFKGAMERLHRSWLQVRDRLKGVPAKGKAR